MLLIHFRCIHAKITHMKKYTLFFIILILIFISSSQPYEQSTLIPTLKQWVPHEPFKELLSNLKIPYWGITVSIEERGYFAFVEFLIRKGMHLITFGSLAISAHIITKGYMKALMITVAIAILDECYQSTIPGRTAELHDVWLDTSGALLALIVISVLNKFRKAVVPS